MRDGFVKVAAVTPDIRVADVAYNTQNICKLPPSHRRSVWRTQNTTPA